MAQKPPQIALIDKPKGITTYDVIRALKPRFRGLKIGHAGTLDPNATGLVILGIGEGTKELGNYLKLPKTYEAEIMFGLRTDSGDTDGKTIEESDASALEKSALEAALQKITGTHSFAVPKFSAIKVGGVPLYKRARKNEEFTPPEKEMAVTKAELLDFKKEGTRVIAQVVFDVGSGTYIRTLAEEIGKTLGLPATLSNLRRTKIGEFRIEDAEKLE